MHDPQILFDLLADAVIGAFCLGAILGGAVVAHFKRKEESK